jgi:hypothetical protein
MKSKEESGVKDQEPKGNMQGPKLGERSDCPSSGGEHTASERHSLFSDEFQRILFYVYLDGSGSSGVVGNCFVPCLVSSPERYTG